MVIQPGTGCTCSHGYKLAYAFHRCDNSAPADSSKVDFRRLISILHMAHKFGFPDHKNWAKILVEKHCVGDGENAGLLGQCSIEDFKQIYTLRFQVKKRWPNDTR